MTDPRTILSAAGVSVSEVEEYREATSEYNRESDRRILNHSVSGAFFVMDHADAAILALALEVAKWRWLAEHDAWLDGGGAYVTTRKYVLDILLARYAEEVQG